VSHVTDERAVSSTLSYTLTLAITAILITGLLTAGGAFVSDQRETVVRSELRTVGQQMAADIERADRLVRAADTSGATTVRITDQYPDRLAGTTYSTELVSNAPGPAKQELVLEAVDPDVRVTVSMYLQSDVGNSNAGSGAMAVRYTGSELVIENA